MRNSISDFTKWLKLQVTNHGIYLWGAQGEKTNELTIADVVRYERTSSTSSKTQLYNAGRVLQTIGSFYKSNFEMKNSRAFDCSGLGVCYFLDQHFIGSDDTAAGLYKRCVDIPIGKTQPGDMVFKSSKNSGIYHVGYVVDGGYVVEAEGRDYGLVKRKQSAGGWNLAARPTWWGFEMSRTLKRTSPLMTGDDVGQLQARLTAMGYPCGTIDGEFGTKTENALTDAQTMLVKSKKLKKCTYGTMDKNTALCLGFEWN